MNLKKHKNYLIIIIMVIILVFQNIYVVSENTKDLLVVSLIIDTSGSMNTTDPQRLREAAANVFIDLLSPEDYLGIITFNNEVDLVIPMEQLKDISIRESFKERLSPNLEAGGNTDYKAALEKSSEELSKLDNSNARKVIVLLTDGEPIPGGITGNEKEFISNYMESLWNTISSLSQKNYPVYSIGFSDQINVEVLDRIAKETNGDVNIFKDASDLDVNLIQGLKSREIIETQLLAQADENKKPLELTTDFWIKEEGYRNGEEAVVSASLKIGANRLQGGTDLVINEFNLITVYDDGTTITVPLLGSEEMDNGDIRANDGIWSNKIVFNKSGNAKTAIVVSGKYKKESFKLMKSLGNYRVDNPGNIVLSSYEKNLWGRGGKTLLIPLTFDNQSSFKEMVSVDIDEKIGNANIRQIELEPYSKSNIVLNIELNSSLDRGIYDLKIKFKPLNQLTTIDNTKLNYKVELLSYFESLYRNLESRYTVVIPLALIFIGLPLFIYIMGILLYIIIVNPQTKVNGILAYWDEISPENKVEFNLSEKKKDKILISFDPYKSADFYIEGGKYKYDFVISKKIIKKSSSFILGWKGLLSRKSFIEQTLSCTQPGIIIYEGDIFTKLNLYDGREFSSDIFGFKFTTTTSKWSKDHQEGKDILEGRI